MSALLTGRSHYARIRAYTRMFVVIDLTENKQRLHYTRMHPLLSAPLRSPCEQPFNNSETVNFFIGSNTYETQQL